MKKRHPQAVVKLKPEKNAGLNRIQTHDLCDTGAVFYQLSYQADWELATMWVRNIPVEAENSNLDLKSSLSVFWFDDQKADNPFGKLSTWVVHGKTYLR